MTDEMRKVCAFLLMGAANAEVHGEDGGRLLRDAAYRIQNGEHSDEPRMAAWMRELRRLASMGKFERDEVALLEELLQRFAGTPL